MQLLSYGPDVEVKSPEKLREQLSKSLKESLGQYQ
jgi:predicted DNA-binding transcriptional regulator YafY